MCPDASMMISRVNVARFVVFPWNQDALELSSYVVDVLRELNPSKHNY